MKYRLCFTLLVTVCQAAAASTNHLRTLLTEPDPRIVGGKATSVNAYPFYVSWGGQCGASLIAREWIMSAAHCDPISTNSVKINRSRGIGHEVGRGDTNKIIDRYPHPDYKGNTHDNDIMIMRLQEPVLEHEPVPLNFNPSIPYNNQDLKVIGFGRLESGGSSPTTLQEVIVQYEDTRTCNREEAYDGDILESMFCAGVDGGGKDSCQGDSGGPIFTTDTGAQVGVVSWGQGCARPNKPGVYARISHFEDWIKGIICSDEDHNTQYKPAFCGGSGLSVSSYQQQPSVSSYQQQTTDDSVGNDDWYYAEEEFEEDTDGSDPTYEDALDFATSFNFDQAFPSGNTVGISSHNTGDGPSSGKVQVRLDITFDEFPDEVSWRFVQNNEVVASGAGIPRSKLERESYSYHLKPGPVTFTMTDSHQDGICCGSGEGKYEIVAVMVDGNDVISLAKSNGEFGASETKSFIIPGSSSSSENDVDSGVADCYDSESEKFYVPNTVGHRTCSWLANNFNEYEHLCQFFDVAVKCRVTCDVCHYWE